MIHRGMTLLQHPNPQWITLGWAKNAPYGSPPMIHCGMAQLQQPESSVDHASGGALPGPIQSSNRMNCCSRSLRRTSASRQPAADNLMNKGKNYEHK